MQDRAVKFAKQNGDACFNLASELANAKDLTDVLSIQSRHAQTQLQSYALQAQELSRLMVEAAQSACSRSRRQSSKVTRSASTPPSRVRPLTRRPFATGCSRTEALHTSPHKGSSQSRQDALM